MGLIKVFFVFLLWYPFRALVQASPPAFNYFLGRLGGRVLARISRRKACVMAEELRLVLPQKDHGRIGEIVKKSFENYCLSEMEVLLYPVLDRKYIDQVFVIEGEGHLKKAYEAGKGVVLFQAHFGAFQMVMPAIGYRGYKMSQISASASVWKDDKVRKSLMHRVMDKKAEYEYTLPVTHIPVQSNLRPAFRALEGGEVLGVTVDGGGGKNPIEIGFLGRRAYFQTGGAELALRTGATIVPVFITTGRNLSHGLIIHEPIEPRGGSKEDKVRSIMEKFAGLLEAHVLRHPDHYGYSLFLRRALAEVDDYPFFLDHAPNKTKGKKDDA